MTFLIILVLLIPPIIYFVRYGTSRIVVGNYDAISPDATIIGISHKKDTWGRDAHIETIVTFSDGVEYHTFKSRGEPGFGYTKLVVDKEVTEAIVENAIKAHNKLVSKTGLASK